MRPEMLAFYERMARGGTGLIIVESPTIDYPAGRPLAPALPHRRRPLHRGAQGTGGRHPQARLPDLHADEPRRSLAGQSVSHRAQPGLRRAAPGRLAGLGALRRPTSTTRSRASSPSRRSRAWWTSSPRRRSGPRRRASTASTSTPPAATCSTTSSPRSGTAADDIYGGSSENRSRFPCQVITEIKRRCGKDFACTMIINGLEVGQVAGLRRQPDAHPADRPRERALAREGRGRRHHGEEPLARLPRARAISPTCSSTPIRPSRWRTSPRSTTPSRTGAGANTLLAAGIKKEVSIPVTVVGRLDADLGEKVLEAGHGRLHRHDQTPPRRSGLREQAARAGRLDDIAPCTGCDNCLGTKRCRINALLGTPYTDIEKADKKKKVLVIGGGPGGMEAARVSALRGHDVTLYEKAPKLGGLLPIAAIVKGPHPEDVPLIVEYLERPDSQAGGEGGHGQRGRHGHGRADQAGRGLPGHRRHGDHPGHQGDRPAERGERRGLAQEAQDGHPLRVALQRFAGSRSSTCPWARRSS